MPAKDDRDHDHENHGMLEGGRSLVHYTVDFLRNFRDYDAPFAEKMRLAVKNRWRSTGHLRPCCGHPGQPGC
jgi:hypothetical protein